MLAIILSGCKETPSYPCEITLELVSKQNMDLFQVETAKPIFELDLDADDLKYNYIQNPWYTTVGIYYSGDKEINHFYSYRGGKISWTF